MDTKVTRFFFQTTERLSRLHGAWVGAMKGTEVALRRHESPTKDALGNALFMWAKEQNPEDLARKLEPFLDKFDQIWSEKDQLASGGKPEPKVSHPQAVKATKKKGTA